MLLREIRDRGCPAGDHAADTSSKPPRPSKKDQQVKDDDGFPSSSLRYLRGLGVETVATQIAVVMTVPNPTKPANDFASDNISPLSDCPRHCVSCHGMPWAEPWLSTAQVARMLGCSRPHCESHYVSKATTKVSHLRSARITYCRGLWRRFARCLRRGGGDERGPRQSPRLSTNGDSLPGSARPPSCSAAASTRSPATRTARPSRR